MWRIGTILFTIGLLLISPFDEIFILTPLSALVGVWVFPLFFVLALLCLVIGGWMVGRHIIQYLTNPLVLLCMGISIVIVIYLIVTSGWLNPFLEYI